MSVSVRETIVALFEQVASEQRHNLATLTDDCSLMATGLDSLAFAIVVARLEDSLGIDPFGATGNDDFPVTFGDFVQMYERTFANAAP